MFNTYNKVRIVAVRTAVPANAVNIEDEIEHYDGNIKKIQRLQKIAGIDTRRIAPDGVTASDLCAHAAQSLFEKFPEFRDTIDALIFMTQTPDWRQPATACELQHRLQLPTTCATFDVNQGCSGYVYGLWLAGSLIESGAAKTVLVLAGDAPAQRIDRRNRILAPVFGDGGSATILTYDPTAQPTYFGIGSDGSGYDAIITPAGAGRIPFVREHTHNAACVEDMHDAEGTPWQLFDTFMDGKKVFEFTMRVVPKHIMASLDYAKLSHEDIGALILHQANRQIMQNIAMSTNFPIQKVLMESFSKYGNLANASIPTAMCDEGVRLLQLMHNTEHMALLCGYGIGLSWASCICSLQQTDFAPVLDFTPSEDFLPRKELIQKWKEKLTNAE